MKTYALISNHNGPCSVIGDFADLLAAIEAARTMDTDSAPTELEDDIDYDGSSDRDDNGLIAAAKAAGWAVVASAGPGEYWTVMRPPTIASLAAEAHSYLYRGERETPGIGPILLSKTAEEGCPQWVHDLCMNAHRTGFSGMMLPDDWRYEFVGDALNVIEDDPEGDAMDAFREWIDSAYIFTAAVHTAWLASRDDRHSYCDQAMADLGVTLDGDDRGILVGLKLGMAAEAEEVFLSVLSSLQERLAYLEGAQS